MVGHDLGRGFGPIVTPLTPSLSPRGEGKVGVFCKGGQGEIISPHLPEVGRGDFSRPFKGRLKPPLPYIQEYCFQEIFGEKQWHL